jgi:glutathione synthase
MNLLILTDHTTHSETNSTYALAQALRQDARCDELWVATKGLAANYPFFNGEPNSHVYGNAVTTAFHFDPTGDFFHRHVQEIPLDTLDAMLIRMPQPADPVFLMSLENLIPVSRIINQPSGILETSSKEFLAGLPHLCPLPVMCESPEEAIHISHQYELVLKPLYSYGGRGIMRLSPTWGWLENERYPIREFYSFLEPAMFPMLSMRFLKQVTQGDKRNIVVNRQVLGSAIRFPPDGSWMCNVAQGGYAKVSEMDEHESEIAAELIPLLFARGVMMFGFDTLVDDDGKRVLSEINTLSIGGLLPLQEMSRKPILTSAASSIWDYLHV